MTRKSPGLLEFGLPQFGLPEFAPSRFGFSRSSSSSLPRSPRQSPPPPSPPLPLDYFRRADDLTNLRLPGSAPFHMKVTFHAFPGMDFSRPGKSEILIGDGAYEETWLSPRKWRREVTFGSYHALEVRAQGARKFQASSDYGL